MGRRKRKQAEPVSVSGRFAAMEERQLLVVGRGRRDKRKLFRMKKMNTFILEKKELPIEGGKGQNQA